MVLKSVGSAVNKGEGRRGWRWWKAVRGRAKEKKERIMKVNRRSEVKRLRIQ